MIFHLDELLRSLLVNRIPGLTRERVGFQPPNADWVTYVRGQLGVTVNLYLVGFSEKLDLRSNGRVRETRGHKVFETRAPRRLNCHYMITAWSPAIPNPPALEPTLQEHEMLHKVATVLVNAEPMVPKQILPAQPPGFPDAIWDVELPSELLPCEDFPATIDLWNTMAEPWRPSLHLTVTLPLLFGTPFEELMVTTRIAEHSQIGGSGAAGTSIEIGGQVTKDTPPKPVASAWVRLETLAAEPLQTTGSDADGRFTFAGLSAGSYLLRVRAAGHPEATRTISVPSPTGEYDVKLS